MTPPAQLQTLMVVVVLMEVPNHVGLLRLPPPLRVSMKSINMRHTLTWRPLQAACNTTVLYSVQYQGEFELQILNGHWVDAPECRQIPDTRCDLTFDLGSDSDYNVRVQAQCGQDLSTWTQLDRTFNRRHTVLTAPEMAVAVVGGTLQVSFSSPPLMASIRVTVWRKGHEQRADVYIIPAEQTELSVTALEEGVVYCIRAQTVVDSDLQSSSSDAYCQSIPGSGAEGLWKKPTTVAFTVICTAGFLFAVFWSIIHCPPGTFLKLFHKEPLPLSLRSDWEAQTPMTHQGEELCEQIHVVPIVDP
ncbi:interleukin-20 receptor subunit beta-like isoform X1 [Sphaeramia orbicularis]|uniref:interleukin-20 receptor subunit beta-like isoform X1 n=1 Tax=Sphaeramia orbicularis TaxID=375764 RepID=UPI00117FD719|nr:interleukin-20 receptor subunit beta-like isoform X1 [Sphaeramia orbicularis]